MQLKNCSRVLYQNNWRWMKEDLFIWTMWPEKRAAELQKPKKIWIMLIFSITILNVCGDYFYSLLQKSPVLYSFQLKALLDIVIVDCKLSRAIRVATDVINHNHMFEHLSNWMRHLILQLEKCPFPFYLMTQACGHSIELSSWGISWWLK